MTISANKSEAIQTISQIGVSLLSLSFNGTSNEIDIKNSFELINLLMRELDEYLKDSQASNSLKK